MAKEVAIAKRAKISQAQQYVLLAVVGASLFLGAAIAIILYFIQLISFNANVMAEEDSAIKAYSSAISSIGVCRRPSGDVYTAEELDKCNPNNIDVSAVQGSLRSEILEQMAANEALNSVPKEDDSACLNPSTGKNYTYSEMTELYNDASTNEQLAAASSLIRSCSALRIIPDALPASKNEEALLSSLNKIFIISGWEPESLSPSGETNNSSSDSNLKTFSVRLSVEADVATTVNVLDNIERSIREFNIGRASIEWGSDNTLILQAQATTYYTETSKLVETSKTINFGGKK